ncbi:MAG TPA: PASTA domain-containing protein [Bacteroidota bacterium]|nr:PASTA domain-containing protein [Bacteroidota bacterium]
MNNVPPILHLLKKWLTSLLKGLMNPWFAYPVGGILVLLVLLNNVILPWYVDHGGTLRVPDVTRMKLEDAMQKLDEVGLVGIQAETILDNDYSVGTVISQNPRPEAVVKYGRHVYLNVCGGEVLVSVPALRGRSLRDARFALERSGIVLREIHYAASDSLPQNTVMGQTLAPNSRVRKGTSIDLVLSVGRGVLAVEIPDLTGKTLSEAERLLARMGLRVGNVTYQVNPDLVPNTVVDQFPMPGIPADSTRRVDLFVVKAGKISDER